MEFGGRIRCQNGKIGYEDKTEQIEAKMAGGLCRDRTRAGHDHK
jgi:hypothetical protein